LGSGGYEIYWEEKYVDYVGSLQGSWPIRANKFEGVDRYYTETVGNEI
jgi:hypothetical protein